MNPERTITICGKEVRMRYCAATESGYEKMAHQSSAVFAATIKKFKEDGTPEIIEPPKAIGSDFLQLAIAGIVAAYAKEDQESPITSDEILYEASPDDILLLTTTIIELRKEWYNIPSTIPVSETDEQPAEEAEKNA